MGVLDSIQGYQRAAAFLLGLEPDVASAILKGMRPEVAARIAGAMVDLDPRLEQSGVRDELVRALAREISQPREVRACDADQLQRLLNDAFGRQSDDLLRQIEERRLSSRPFLELEKRPPIEVALLLKQESAAVAALVMAHLAPEQTAQILEHFPEELALDVVMRMVRLEPPRPERLRDLAADLAQRLKDTPPPALGADPGERLRSVARILNSSPPEMEKKVIDALSQSDKDAASELREQLFTWDDIEALDRRAMAKVLGTVDTKTLAIALKGCSPELEQHILSNLSSRVRDMVLEERDLAGALPVADVKQARGEILGNIRALIEAGEFRPSRGGENLVS